MPTLQRCRKCNGPIASDAKVCPHCGTSYTLMPELFGASFGLMGCGCLLLLCGVFLIGGCIVLAGLGAAGAH